MEIRTLFRIVRAYLQDEEDGGSKAPFRYTDQELLDLLNQGVREIFRMRPDAFIGLYDLALYTYTVTDLTNNTVIDVPREVVGSLEFYMVATAEGRDDEYTTDGRAAGFLAQFYRQLGVRAA